MKSRPTHCRASDATAPAGDRASLAPSRRGVAEDRGPAGRRETGEADAGALAYNLLVRIGPRQTPDATDATTEHPTAGHPVVVSYRAVRRAIGGLGLAFPAVMVVGGWLAGAGLQPNLSAYYHTPMRDLFVGMLCTLGIFFFCYRGYDRLEDWTANLACVFALGLAFCPIDAGSDPLAPRSAMGLIHTISGGGFFLTLAVYSLFHFPRTSDASDAEPHPVERKLLYRLSGMTILLSMLAMGGYLLLLPDAWKAPADRWNALMWLEWIAIWSFAAAWLLKGRVIVADLAVDLLAAAKGKWVRR